MIKKCFKCGRSPLLHLNGENYEGMSRMRCPNSGRCKNEFVAVASTSKEAIKKWNIEMIFQEEKQNGHRTTRAKILKMLNKFQQ